MGQSLRDIAQQLKDNSEKVQLIYAFNGIGKTRLSREFKELIAPKESYENEEETTTGIKFLYYNAFTEDLFYWDNDLDYDINRKLIIRPNGFTDFTMPFLKDQGQDNNIVLNFQHYTSNKITPKFNEEYTTQKDGKDITVKAFSEVTFSITRGDDTSLNNVKVSKGEESNFIWCVFYSLLEQIIEVLNTPETEERPTDKFNDLEYVFIDDPVSSLDDNHLIELAVDIATLIKKSQFNRTDKSGLKFIITTHNPLFYNVLFNEFNNAEPSSGYKRKDSGRSRLEKFEDGTFELFNQSDDSPFSYHLYLLSELDAIQQNDVKKYHFNFLRNILEKTSTFLGYKHWKDILPNETEGARENYYSRIINFASHSKHHAEEVSEITDNDKRVLKYLIRELKKGYEFQTNQ